MAFFSIHFPEVDFPKVPQKSSKKRLQAGYFLFSREDFLDFRVIELPLPGSRLPGRGGF
jgi:hypothetical protein